MHEYMPIMRFHQGEARAMAQLPLRQSTRLLPLFEVAPIRLPLNSNETNISMEQRLANQSQDITQATFGAPVLIDMSLIDPKWRDPGGQFRRIDSVWI